MKTIVFITKNVAKVNLAKLRLNKFGIKVIQKEFKFNEIQNIDVVEVAKNKAKQAFARTSDKFIIEDSALYIEALNGFPGTLLKLVFDLLGDEKVALLLKNEKNRNASVKSVLVYGDPLNKQIKIFTGIYEGKIAIKPKGNNLRGWQILRIFIPKNGKKTLAELNDSGWRKFLKDFQDNDHFEQFGKWIEKD